MTTSVRIKSGGSVREWYHFSGGWLVTVQSIMFTNCCYNTAFQLPKGGQVRVG